jgi:hypothetical protein
LNQMASTPASLTLLLRHRDILGVFVNSGCSGQYHELP